MPLKYFDTECQTWPFRMTRPEKQPFSAWDKTQKHA